MTTENSVVENVEAAPVVEKPKRRPAVTDRDIIMAYQTVANSGDEDACKDKAAELAGMNPKSFDQRITKIRKGIEAAHKSAMKKYEADLAKSESDGTDPPTKPVLFELAEMPRKAGGGRKPKDVDFMSMLSEVNAELAQ